MGISYHSCIGSSHDALPPLPCNAAGNTSLNSPIGNCIDRYGNVWLADTGHNRLLIFNATLEQVLARFGRVGSGPRHFNMPFRLLAHPTRDWVYVTDMGNNRIHILAYSYTQDGTFMVYPVRTFGQQPGNELSGPNGLAFHDGMLCVSDEFHDGPDGASRLAIYTDEGDYLRSIYSLDNGPDTPASTLLWPQGLSTDRDGNLYIANTGHGSVLRCDWQGNTVPFLSTGTAQLEHTELARDICCTDNHILVPGGESHAISIYQLNGEPAGQIKGFFAPVQITSLPNPEHLLVTEPVLASLQICKVKLQPGTSNLSQEASLAHQVGDTRNRPGQLHFVTATAGGLSSNPPMPYQMHPLLDWFYQQQSKQEAVLDQLRPSGLPFWLHQSLDWQRDWLQGWQRNWFRMLSGTVDEPPSHQLWMVDAGNYRLQANHSGNRNSSYPDSTSLLPGSLGLAPLRLQQPLPSQLAADMPLLVVSNYLCHLVSLYQFDPTSSEFIPYSIFGRPGDFNHPQGLAVDQESRDILIADSGNHRISCWRLNNQGKAEFSHSFGSEGTGNGQFRTPSDIALDEHGRCYVTDQGNHRIQVFDRQGNWLYSFGRRGYSTDDDHFLLPTSIEYEDGYLFVSDLVNRAIKIFDTRGNFVTSFASFGADASQGQLWMPYLLHVRNRRIYLPDCALNRVNIYQFDPEALQGPSVQPLSTEQPAPQQQPTSADPCLYEQAMADRLSVRADSPAIVRPEEAAELHQQISDAVDSFRADMASNRTQATTRLRKQHQSHSKKLSDRPLKYPHS